MGGPRSDISKASRKEDLKEISISPFHNEHIPFANDTGVMTAARRAGIGLFPWSDVFIPDLTALDPRKPHGVEEFEAQYGPDYLQQVLRRYWIHLGGRALNTFREVLPQKPLAQILDEKGAAGSAADRFPELKPPAFYAHGQSDDATKGPHPVPPHSDNSPSALQ